VLSALVYTHSKGICPGIEALNIIKSKQKAEGCWYGRWGVNYTYGTGQVLQGLMATGENPQADYIRKAITWLDGVQNKDGGWGDSVESYTKGAYVAAPSTIFQSAYALIGLISAGEANTPQVEKGIPFLVDSQLPDGSWYDEEFLGADFPDYLYSRYTLLSTYKALYALTLYLNNR
jgi:squalene-hopene/tetraprenyl-beta-curcumene cyclase